MNWSLLRMAQWLYMIHGSHHELHSFLMALTKGIPQSWALTENPLVYGHTKCVPQMLGNMPVKELPLQCHYIYTHSTGIKNWHKKMAWYISVIHQWDQAVSQLNSIQTYSSVQTLRLIWWPIDFSMGVCNYSEQIWQNLSRSLPLSSL